jgi:hypothetical protein
MRVRTTRGKGVSMPGLSGDDFIVSVCNLADIEIPPPDTLGTFGRHVQSPSCRCKETRREPFIEIDHQVLVRGGGLGKPLGIVYSNDLFERQAWHPRLKSLEVRNPGRMHTSKHKIYSHECGLHDVKVDVEVTMPRQRRREGPAPEWSIEKLLGRRHSPKLSNQSSCLGSRNH